MWQLENLPESVSAVLSDSRERRSLWDLNEDGAGPGGAQSMWVGCGHPSATSSLAPMSLSLSITTCWQTLITGIQGCLSPDLPCVQDCEHPGLQFKICQGSVVAAAL